MAYYEKTTISAKYSSRTCSKTLAVLISLLSICTLAAAIFIPYILDKNALWRSNEIILERLETAVLREYSNRLQEDSIVESPYVVFFLEGSEYLADIDDAKIWYKPFISMSDDNINKINTFIFVLNRRADHASYTDRSSLTTYDAVIKYFDRNGVNLGQDYINADPLPKKKNYGNGGQSSIYISKRKVIQRVKSHIQ